MRKRTAHGAAIRAIREALGIPVGVFAVRCGMSQGHMSNIELGVKAATPEKLRVIATQLGVSIDAISYVIPTCQHAEENAA